MTRIEIKIPYDEDKLEALVLYVADRMSGDPFFGATKLNKVLFFADFIHYAEFGSAITGAEYQKLPQGPAPRRLVPVRDHLIANGMAAMKHDHVGTYSQKRLIALRSADLSAFKGTEIAVVDEVISALSGQSASAVSELSHRVVGWQVVGERETIPYPTVFLYDGPVAEADELDAKRIEGRLSDDFSFAVA